MKVETNPFEHLIIDNHADNYKDIIKDILSVLKSGKIKRAHTLVKGTNLRNLNLAAINKFIDSIDLKEYLNTFTKVREYEKLHQFSELNICVGEVSYRIHDETPNKIISAVSYFYPKESIGTYLYNKDKTFNKEIDWIPNRTLIFAGDTETSWHSYHNKPGDIRVSINTFLINENDIYQKPKHMPA